jgi:hypothetical protein
MPMPEVGFGLKCQHCLYSTDKVKEAMRHAEDTGHTVTGPGALEGTTLTVSVERD